mmetsp:Transcript_45652/g.108455  ORF Transcript_45652/g.108455 Transcript_45652/m.108455 type:complete len:279 (-) Transcript_45652:51-887(-)
MALPVESGGSTQAAEAWVTMVTSSDYVAGAVTLAHSLRQHAAPHRPLLCMVTDNLTDADRKVLRAAQMELEHVKAIPAPAASGVAEWDNVGYTKLNLWRLTRWRTLVYIDADCVVKGSMDDVFERGVSFAAAPDTFPPDRFNAGVMLVRPDITVFEDMVQKAPTTVSYDGGDTGFLNAYFPNWYASEAACRLPFACNALRTMRWMTKGKPGYWDAVGPIKCVHYCSFPKPWEGKPSGDLERDWWVLFAGAQLALLRKGVAVCPPEGRARGGAASDSAT